MKSQSFLWSIFIKFDMQVEHAYVWKVHLVTGICMGSLKTRLPSHSHVTSTFMCFFKRKKPKQ